MLIYKIFTVFFIIFSSISVLRAEIDDSSFSNDGRYALLSDIHLQNTKSVDLQIQFLPPKGKKVNEASYVKIWEKKNAKWSLVKKFTAEQDVFNPNSNKLKTRANFETSDSEFALEVEFIYCNKFGGGQCDMERFLTKVIRNSHSKKTAIILNLKI